MTTTDEHTDSGTNTDTATEAIPDGTDAAPAGAPKTTESEAAEPAAETVEEPSATGQGGVGREAARYRRQLRDTEAERDSLRAERDALRRGHIEQLAQAAGATRGADVADVTDIATLLGEDGRVDPERVAARVAELRAERPHWFAPPPRTRQRQVRQVSEDGTNEAPAPGWSQLMSPKGVTSGLDD